MRGRKIFLFGILTVAAIATGCASSKGPNALTGDNTAPDLKEQARWTDSRGYYHADWRAGINRPAGYPKDVR